MILLDTNAVIWILTENPRIEALWDTGARLFLSPVSLLELQFLHEVGRLAPAPGKSVADVAQDPRWEVDSPSSDRLFRSALSVSWTRDPFDRLLVAHALTRRFRFATGDRKILANLEKANKLQL